MIRVLRIMEYVYENAEDMEDDMGRWQIPANGNRIGRGMRPLAIRSAVMIDYKFEDNADQRES